MKALGKGSIASIVQVGLLVAWWALWLAAAVWALLTVAYAVFMLLVGVGVIDPAAIPAVERPDGDGVQIQISGIDPDVFRNIQWTDWQIFAPVLLIGAVTVGGSLLIVGRLRQLFAAFTSAEPFRRENAQHLRVIWITMVVMELARYALLAAIGIVLGVFGAPDSIGEASFSIDSENFSSWMSILILICLAEVFREGARLKEEQELTI
jgi:hypothetical protein